MVTHALEWPTLTTDWLPDVEVKEGKTTIVKRLIIGTNTSGNDPNFLHIANVTLPGATTMVDTRASSYDEEQSGIPIKCMSFLFLLLFLELGGYGGADCKVQIMQSIVHEGEVNRARHMPQNPCLIATRTVQGDVLFFDYTKHPSNPSSLDVCKPDLRLKGHRGEGYGLSWNRMVKGHLLTCDDNDTICLWDVTAGNKDTRHLSPKIMLSGHHGSAVEDVDWNCYQPDLFVSVGDDRRLLLYSLFKLLVSLFSIQFILVGMQDLLMPR